MRDITVIIPVLLEHIVDSENVGRLKNAVESVDRAAARYKGGKVGILIVRPESDDDDIEFGLKTPVRYVHNDGDTDFCTQVNLGVGNTDTEYFSILEFDDYYMDKWFAMFDEYHLSHEDVSVFLPVNVLHNIETDESEFVNEIVWAASFSDEIGFIDFECLENCSLFNLTGGVFRTEDWLGLKPSLKVSFNYEYLLRATHKKQKVFVVPKEGYHHEIFREGSLSREYIDTISDKDTELWFKLAKRECMFDEDRNKGIIKEKVEDLK